MDNGFLGAIPPTCTGTLRILGISPNGRMVLAISPGNGCRSTELWELSYRQKKAKDGGVLPETPNRLPSDARITRLDPGTRVAGSPRP